MSVQQTPLRGNPFFVVGHPRSGTKILRDTLKSSREVTTTEHNLNEIWQLVQSSRNHHEIDPAEVTNKAIHSIRREFNRYFDTDGVWIEKNICHSLRLPAVSKVFPEAGYVVPYRHPLDAITSIRERWQQPIEWKYFLSRKILELPYHRLPKYVYRQLKKTIRRCLASEEHVSTWGPVYEGLQDELQNNDLLEVCARQWKVCVRRVLEYEKNHESDFFFVNYEELMKNPEGIIPELVSFLGLEDSDNMATFADQYFHSRSIGRWRTDLTDEEISEIWPIVQPETRTLERRGDLEFER